LITRRKLLQYTAVTGRTFDVIATWQARAAMKVTGKALPGRHFLPEEAPERTLAELRAFLSTEVAK